MKSGNVLAIVNDKELTKEEVQEFIELMGPRGAQFHDEEGLHKVADELINQEVIYLDAIKRGLDQEQEYIEEVKRIKESALKQYAINKIFENISISEDEIKSYYESHKEHFKLPAKMKASHILVDTEEQARDIKKEIENGKSFAEAAKEFSSCPSKEKGGSLGEFSQGKMVPEFEIALLTQEIGSISDPVKTQFGYHLIQLEDRQDESFADLDTVKEELKKQIYALKQQEYYLKATEELKRDYKIEKFY